MYGQLNKSERIWKAKTYPFPLQKVSVYIIPSSRTLCTKLLFCLFIRIMTALQLVSEKSVPRIWYLKPDLWVGNNSWSGYFLSLNKLKYSLELGLKSPSRALCKSPLRVSSAANTVEQLPLVILTAMFTRAPWNQQQVGTLWQAVCGRSWGSREPGKAGHRHRSPGPSSPAPLGLPAAIPASHPHRHLCQERFPPRLSPRRFWCKELSEEIV